MQKILILNLLFIGNYIIAGGDDLGKLDYLKKKLDYVQQLLNYTPIPSGYVGLFGGSGAVPAPATTGFGSSNASGSTQRVRSGRVGLLKLFNNLSQKPSLLLNNLNMS